MSKIIKIVLNCQEIDKREDNVDNELCGGFSVGSVSLEPLMQGGCVETELNCLACGKANQLSITVEEMEDAITEAN